MIEAEKIMDIIVNTALDGALVICLGISFISFKFIRTKRRVLCHLDDKATKLLKFGSFFFGLGLLILAIQVLIGIDH